MGRRNTSSKVPLQGYNKIYGPFFAYIAKAAATMALHKAFQAAVGAADIDGLVSGASESFFVFQSAPSEIDVLGADPVHQNNEVYLIGHRRARRSTQPRRSAQLHTRFNLPAQF
jgi:hypothetical protein